MRYQSYLDDFELATWMSEMPDPCGGDKWFYWDYTLVYCSAHRKLRLDEDAGSYCVCDEIGCTENHDRIDGLILAEHTWYDCVLSDISVINQRIRAADEMTSEDDDLWDKFQESLEEEAEALKVLGKYILHWAYKQPNGVLYRKLQASYAKDPPSAFRPGADPNTFQAELSGCAVVA